MCPSGRIASQFDGRLDGFGTGVRQKNFFWRGPRSEPAELFRKLGHRLIIEVAAAEVQELARLLLDGLNYFWMGVAGSGHGDPGGEIQKEISIHILDHRPPSFLDHQ